MDTKEGWMGTKVTRECELRIALLIVLQRFIINQLHNEVYPIREDYFPLFYTIDTLDDSSIDMWEFAEELNEINGIPEINAIQSHFRLIRDTLPIARVESIIDEFYQTYKGHVSDTNE